jgi:hypothetical protein
MPKNLEHIPIVFNSDWFQSGYYVYVLTINHISNVTYYYVGQTGDRFHKAARSPFYRLMAHFRPYKSTDNQLVVGLENKGLIKLEEGKSRRVCIEEAIVNKVIEVKSDYFKIDQFDTLEHQSKTKFVEAVEQEIINTLVSQNKMLINDLNKIGAKKTVISNDAKKKALEIIKSLRIK